MGCPARLKLATAVIRVPPRTHSPNTHVCTRAHCATHAGWRFMKDLEEAQDNLNQVGRWGLVKSSLQRRSAAQLSP